MATTKLERLSAATSTTPPPPFHPRCQTCGDFGYVGCSEALIGDPPYADFIGIAFKKARPCSCFEGKNFAKLQEKYRTIEGKNG